MDADVILEDESSQSTVTWICLAIKQLVCVKYIMFQLAHITF